MPQMQITGRARRETGDDGSALAQTINRLSFRRGCRTLPYGRYAEFAQLALK
jgi:hypothetical protein